MRRSATTTIPNQRYYKPFNMNGERYYTFKKGNPGVRFFALDSNYMSREQLEWLEKELANSDSAWKIAFFHHPALFVRRPPWVRGGPARTARAAVPEARRERGVRRVTSTSTSG